MNPFVSDIDSILIQSLRRGDHGAFERLFQRYAQKIFVFSMSYLKNEADAEEVVQEVFLRIWMNRDSLKSETSFQAYLFTIAYNAMKKMFNAKAKSNQFKLELVDELDDGAGVVDYEKNYQLVVSRLDQFIEQMPERRRLIFVQRKREGRSVRQIAENLNISVKTVENQITEAMKYLKKRFEGELPGGLIYFSLYFEKGSGH